MAKTIDIYELLKETNYRCGYCMRNVTPRVYFSNDDPNKASIYDYFYNISDRCHIEPNSIVKDDYKNFYNLIALCKICHHETDKAKMLDIKELKKLKLHWLVSSGRYTKLQIDSLFNLWGVIKEIDSLFPYGLEKIPASIKEITNLPYGVYNFILTMNNVNMYSPSLMISRMNFFFLIV